MERINYPFFLLGGDMRTRKVKAEKKFIFHINNIAIENVGI